MSDLPEWEKSCESKSIGKEDLREVQSHTARARRPGHLQEPEAQAEAGVDERGVRSDE